MAEKQKLEDEIRTKQEEVMRIQEEVQAKDEETRRLQEEVETARRRQEEAALAMATPASQHLTDMDDDDTPMPNGHSHEFGDGDGEYPDRLEGMMTHVERNQRLQAQMKMFGQELAERKDDTKETNEDKLHKENVKQGRDKYKTLREIRKGNTKRRVDQFENM